MDDGSSALRGNRGVQTSADRYERSELKLRLERRRDRNEEGRSC